MWRAAAALLLMAAAAPASPPEGEPGPGWREGPARYVLSAEEEREARSLRTLAEHREFVGRFWLSRDPTPDTPDNEFQQEFRRRVEAASQLFADTSKPGWKTDRGKIYILLGPPDEIESSPLQPGRRGIVAWIYRSAPQPDLGPQVVVRFAEDASGEYRLSADAFADSQVARVASRQLLPPQLPGPPVSPQGSDLDRRIQQSRLQDVPVVMRVPRVSVHWSSHGNPFRCCASFYLSQDGSTLTALTLEVEPAFLREDPAFQPSGLKALGHLARVGGPDKIDLGTLPTLEPFPPPGSPRPLRFQALQSLRPGPYRAYFALVDDRERLRGSYHEDLDVPALPRTGLALSSVTLVESLGEAAPVGGEPRLEPFVIGHLRVVPRCRPVFAADEELGLYYQIYERSNQAGQEAALLDIEYQFYLLLDGTRYAVGAPLRLSEQVNRVQGQTFHLEGWPPGEYRMSLVVSDPLGARAEREVAFELR